MQAMELKAEKVTGLLKGLANIHRIKVLCQLADGEKSVSALIKATGIAQTSMSQHLLKLRDEGIVDYRREHRTLFYFVTDKVALEIMHVLHKNFCPPKPTKKKRKKEK